MAILNSVMYFEAESFWQDFKGDESWLLEKEQIRQKLELSPWCLGGWCRCRGNTSEPEMYFESISFLINFVIIVSSDVLIMISTMIMMIVMMIMINTTIMMITDLMNSSSYDVLASTGAQAEQFHSVHAMGPQ